MESRTSLIAACAADELELKERFMIARVNKLIAACAADELELKERFMIVRVNKLFEPR